MNTQRKISAKPPRFHQDYSIYFLTFCTDKRLPLLHKEGIPELLEENILFYRARVSQVIAYTIMPDHIHALVEVEKVNQLSIFLRDFKKHTSKEIKKHLSIDAKHIWQRGTMDHCIRVSWKNKDYQNHLEYIFYNSYKHLAIKPQDYQYHNFNEIVERGLVDPVFFDFDEKEFPLQKLYE